MCLRLAHHAQGHACGLGQGLPYPVGWPSCTGAHLQRSRNASSLNQIYQCDLMCKSCRPACALCRATFYRRSCAQVGRLLPALEAGRERKGAVILTAKEEKARPPDVLRHAHSNCLMRMTNTLFLENC